MYENDRYSSYSVIYGDVRYLSYSAIYGNARYLSYSVIYGNVRYISHSVIYRNVRYLSDTVSGNYCLLEAILKAADDVYREAHTVLKISHVNVPGKLT